MTADLWRREPAEEGDEIPADTGVMLDDEVLAGGCGGCIVFLTAGGGDGDAKIVITSLSAAEAAV